MNDIKGLYSRTDRKVSDFPHHIIRNCMLIPKCSAVLPGKVTEGEVGGLMSLLWK